MNPYSQLGLDQSTMGNLAQAGIDPAGSFQQSAKSAAYPTYPNAAGIGSQTAGVVSQNETTSPSGSGVVTPNKNEIPDASARGLTPYSLLGDANYRVT